MANGRVGERTKCSDDRGRENYCGCKQIAAFGAAKYLLETAARGCMGERLDNKVQSNRPLAAGGVEVVVAKRTYKAG